MKKIYGRVFALAVAVCASLMVLGCGGGYADEVIAASLDCPSGQVATGIAVRKGEVIDNLALICATRIESIIETDTSTQRASVGGTGGSAQAPFTCSQGKGLTKIAGFNSRNSWRDMLVSVQVTCGGDELSPNYSGGIGDREYSFQCDAVNKVATGVKLNLSTKGVNSYAGHVTGITCVELYPLG